MTVKLIMTWDITPGREQEYFEFVVREFIPQVQQLGMELKDAWLTMYGDQPQIMASAQMADLPAMQGILDSKEWQGLVNRLLDYVENYQYKIVPAKSGFQM
ncbi:MAG: hypothetical protein A2Z71_03575 [Chloroflexi bacterium RBG_13_50_21]|nr:MAG: hypothetical protein A2Z71_03575 [Chloroflexi bacterium RBG_13_50_21]OGO63713.1 MAG: hypothetical protein A2030_10960 [Chloroflexi bacterium RBG_19FT_COMBO_50_10]